MKEIRTLSEEDLQVLVQKSVSGLKPLMITNRILYAALLAIGLVCIWSFMVSIMSDNAYRACLDNRLKVAELLVKGDRSVVIPDCRR